MAIFLKWNETTDGTVDRFLVSMFSTLSPRYYPTNVIDSGLYNILSMYAEEIKDLYDEEVQTFDDLSIDTVRVTPTGDRDVSKLYDNFGVLIKSSKRYDQFYDKFSTASVVQSYRQQVRFLTQAFLDGMSTVALDKLGQSFTGIAPIYDEYIKANPRWILTAYTGSVVAVGENFIVSDVYIPRVGTIIPVEDVSAFSPGDSFSMSFTHLGSNTKLSGEDLFYNTIGVTYFVEDSGVSTQSITSLKNDLEYQALRVIKASQKMRESYNNVFQYYRPFETYSGSVIAIDDLPDDQDIHEKGFLYTSDRIFPTGSIHYTPILDLGERYNIYRWYYDCLVNVREYGSYSLEVRQYPSSSIPDVVYYTPIVTFSDAIPPVLPEDTGSVRAQWFNSASGSMFDALGNVLLTASSVPSYTPILARDPRRFCYLYDSPIVFSNTGDTSLDFGDSMYSQMWLLRLYSGIISSSEAVSVKRQDDSGNYYKIFLSTADKSLGLSFKYGATTETATASVSDYLNLLSPIPHLFAVSFVSGSVYFYADGNNIGSGSFTSFGSVPSLPSATQSISLNAAQVGVDEILLSSGFLTENQAYDDFILTRPRYTGVGIPSASVERYHQAKFIFNGYNVRDVELHQFTIRGMASGAISKFLNPYYNYPYVLPMFKKV